MSKINLDQYFTSKETAEYCFNKAIEIIGKENITEFIETSAGEGVFLDCIEKFTPEIPYQAYDIDKKDKRVVEQDYLTLDLEYKEGRVCGFNPPFGSRNTLSVRFYKKSIQLGDYIVFILPISQLNNNQQMYEFDLVYSEDLKPQIYTDRKVHCCLNIYKRSGNGGYNKKPNYNDINIVDIFEVRDVKGKMCKQLGDFKYDMKILAWGNIGCILKENENYAKTFYIKIKDTKNYDKIYNLIKDAKWQELYPMTATPNLLQWQVYKYLKECIPELE